MKIYDSNSWTLGPRCDSACDVDLAMDIFVFIALSYKCHVRCCFYDLCLFVVSQRCMSAKSHDIPRDCRCGGCRSGCGPAAATTTTAATTATNGHGVLSTTTTTAAAATTTNGGGDGVEQPTTRLGYQDKIACVVILASRSDGRGHAFG
jgi:hypothetical protein